MATWCKCLIKRVLPLFGPVDHDLWIRVRNVITAALRRLLTEIGCFELIEQFLWQFGRIMEEISALADITRAAWADCLEFRVMIIAKLYRKKLIK